MPTDNSGKPTVLSPVQNNNSEEDRDHNAPTEIAVKYAFQGSLRRSTLGFPPKFNQLRKKLAKSFPEAAPFFADKSQLLRLSYVDDEGDECEITTNDELLTAYRIAHAAGKVLRFTVPEPQPKQKSESRKEKGNQQQEADTKPASPLTKHSGLDIDAAATAEDSTAASNCNPTKAQPRAVMLQDITRCVVDAMNGGDPVHWNHSCVITGAAPIVGKRYVLKEDNSTSVCVEAFLAFSEQEKARWMEAKFVPCRIRLPPRIKKCASKLGIAVHRGVFCQHTHVQPIIGPRYTYAGHNLSEYGFQQLNDSDKKKYVFVGVDSSNHNQSWRWARGPAPGNQKWRCAPMPMPISMPTGPVATGGQASSAPSATGVFAPGGFDAYVGAKHEPRGFFRFNSNNKPKNKSASGPKAGKVTAAARFVKDVTINDASNKQPNESFEKAWAMRAGKPGVPVGCCLVFIGGHHLHASELRIPVEDAPIPHGKEFVLKVNFRAPEQPGHYRSFWRLQTPAGHRFGPRLWVDIVVDEPGMSSTTAKSASNTADVKFVKHITIPNGTTVAPGEKLRKTWLVSTLTGWDEGCELKCADLWSAFTGLQEALPTVPANSQAEISITLEAPTTPGNYRSYWSMCAADGKQFGEVLCVDFIVSSDVNATKATELPVAQFAAFANDPTVPIALFASTCDTSGEAIANATADSSVSSNISATAAVATSSTSNGNTEKKALGSTNAILLQRILEGVNQAPHEQHSRLSSILFSCLQKKEDFSDILEALQELGVSVEK